VQAEDLEMQIRDRAATVCVWGIFSMCRPLVDASLVCVDQLMEQNLDDLTSGLITCEALLLGHKTNLPSWASLSTFSSQQPPSNMRARAFAAWFLCSRFRSLGPCSRPRPPPLAYVPARLLAQDSPSCASPSPGAHPCERARAKRVQGKPCVQAWETMA